jgi:uncharacterized protein YndB with AHSA1/START domain
VAGQGLSAGRYESSDKGEPANAEQSETTVRADRVRQETEVNCTADTIFAVIVDLRGYDRWLTPSTAYAGTTDVSADPINAGTTYVESGPGGVRHGTITEFQPPTGVVFHQPMTLKPRPLRIINIHVRYTLTQRQPRSTWVEL